MTIPKYRTIVVDPPWKISNPNTGEVFMAEKRGANKNRPEGLKRKDPHYSEGITSAYEGTMSIDELKDWDLVPRLAAHDCIIFLWIVNMHLFQAPYILEKWGFNLGHGGRVMTWHKGGPCARSPASWLSNGEFVVVGTKGKTDEHRRYFKSTSGLHSVFSAMNEGNSIKPAKFYRMIEPCTYAPRVDVFARRRHLGFDAWGNQVEPYPKEDMFGNTFPDVSVVELGTGHLHIDQSIEDRKQKLL